MTSRTPLVTARVDTVVSFVVPLCLYAWTAARSVQGGDAGEFGLIGMVGGVAHPPGYPLYTLLVRVMGLLPIDPPFWRVSLASSVAAAAAVALIFRVALRLTDNVRASLATAFVFAVSGLHWRLAGIPEVFSLHAFFVALTLLLALRLVQAERSEVLRRALFFGVGLGLAFANHQTIVLCIPLLIAVVIALPTRHDRRAALPAAGLIVLGGLLGLTPYLLLALWGRSDPSHSWVWGSTSSWAGLATHVLRREYGTFRLSSAPATDASAKWHYVVACLRELPKQWAYIGIPAALVGAAMSLRKERWFALGVLGSFLLAAIAFPSQIHFQHTQLYREVAERFFLMPVVLLAPFVACGFALVATRLNRDAFATLMVIAIGFAAVATWPAANWSQDSTLERYLSACVTPLPEKAIVLGTGDSVFSGMGWTTRVRGVRPDIQYVDVNLLRSDWYLRLVRKRFPQLPPAAVSARSTNAQIIQAFSKIGPSYFFPTLMPEASKAMPLRIEGLLYTPATPGAQPQSLDAMRGQVGRALENGPWQAPCVDQWSCQIRTFIATPVSDVISAHARAGADEQVADLVDVLGKLLPAESPDGPDSPIEIANP